MSMNARAYRTLLRFSFTCIPLLVLASTLTGCGPGPMTPVNTFVGKMSVFHVPTPYSLPGTITVGPDGNLWFPAIASSNFGTNRPSGAIGRMTPAGMLSIFTLPTLNSYPRQITVGPDGNLWFTAAQGSGHVVYGVDTPPKFSETLGEIGRITPAGKFGRFSLPSSQAYPDGITSGPDGNLWFTETVNRGSKSSISKIGRISPSGTITEFPLSMLADSARYITAGPDGNLWFTIQSSKGSNAVCKIGRMTPQGAITIFTPGNLYIAGDITSGPDHNLWFSSGYYIGRITPAGKVSEFSLPGHDYSRATAGGITAGSDGALWFATNMSWVGRIAPDGTIKEYRYPTTLAFDNRENTLAGNELKGIITMSDGTLWLTNDGQLGHFV
jgi:virginiamycin B lyase